MKFKKTLGKIATAATAATLGAVLLFAPARKAEAEQILSFRGDLEVNALVRFESLNVQTIPEYIRDVPMHPEDKGYFPEENIAPIADGLLNRYGTGQIIGKVGPVLKTGALEFQVGAECELLATYLAARERNYTNEPGTDQKGNGAALTFVGISNEIQNLGPFLKTSLELNKSFSLFLEYFANLLPHQISLNNGWDRYSELEIKSSNPLATTISDHTLRLGIEYNFDHDVIARVSLFGGIKIPQVSQRTALADEIGLKILPVSYFLGIGGGFSFDSYRLSED